MDEIKQINRWAEKLLDTGKRNNMISFKDTKGSTGEVVFPSPKDLFARCAVGQTFEVFDPKIHDDENDVEAAGNIDKEIDFSESAPVEKITSDRFTKSQYLDLYSGKIRKAGQILIYAQTPNPLTAVKNIAKKAQGILDETGINVAYLAFGFIRWNEKTGSAVYYKAPLILVHAVITAGSVLDPIKIEISDDDVIINPTFDFYLKAEHGISLPEYEDGDTLSAYYSKVKETVGKLGWSILDECKLGLFSFLKINMYEDIKANIDQILENTNVRTLLGCYVPNFTLTPGFAADEARTTVKNDLIDLHTVVDADSSQLEAIKMAKGGTSFVLQGPPGTGKSQTITNIIAECLHDGKKVLFVSEKQAALNVVFDKLRKADLTDFCLELHSYKASKKAVIDELNRTLELPKSLVSSKAEDEIREKEEAQRRLDTYAEELHKTRDVIGKSLYQLYELHASLRKYPYMHLAISNISNKGQEYLKNAEKLLRQYADYMPAIGADYRKNAWYGFNNYRLTYDGRNQLRDDLDLLVRGTQDLFDVTKKIKEKYETPSLGYKDTLKLQKFLEYAADTDILSVAIMTKETYDKVFPAFLEMQKISESAIPMENDFLETFREDIFNELSGQVLYKELTVQFSSFFTRILNSGYKKIIADISMYLKAGGQISYKQAVSSMQTLSQLQELFKHYQELETSVSDCLGPGYKGMHTDWDQLQKSLYNLYKYYEEGNNSFGAASSMSRDVFLSKKTDFRADSDLLKEKISDIDDVRDRISAQFDSTVFNMDEAGYSDILTKLNTCLEQFGQLENWIRFTGLLNEMTNADLIPYIDSAISQSLPQNEIVGTYKKAFYERWIDYIVFSVPVLSEFSRVRQDLAVKEFRAKDKTQFEISKVQIKSELSQNRPCLDLVSGGSPVAVLRREGQKKRKQMPIRKLLSETGELVQIIKPCFLMSPLSVSTFLDPEKIHFDTVIFDEASQIFPQDALGAIYRGKQLIVVGDSKQMPPSNFFNSTVDIDDDEEDIGDISDFESVLDICNSVFTSKRLAWHYRSHYEQLIAFSNLNFYNNTLVTFPSACRDHKGVGVDFYDAGGIFDRKSKTNQKEAEFIVDLIYRNIEEHPERSLGVVAFSVAQQNLIDRLLSKKRELDPSKESFFRSDTNEPFFVKNLETVQGDERDTIIFSVAYAKDAQGRFIHNFGPLNRQGGERRLNVAVTRAKDNIQLVSSIHYNDINLNNSGSEGVRLLRAYLDFAENGEAALERSIAVSQEDHYDSDFELEVCEFLRSNGFTVDTQIGCSGYKIDLGLRRPDSSDYVLAIECDGAAYHSSKNARDRDRLRQQVLENMGWSFYRIWSTDWFRNKAYEKRRLIEISNEALSRGSSSVIGENDNKKSVSGIKDKYVSEIEGTSSEFEKYKELNAAKILRECSNNLQYAIIKILETEAPLSEEYLLKRIVSHFGREKVTKAVLAEYEREMRGCMRRGIIRRNGFLYLKDMGDIKLRIPGDRREIKYISSEELAEGMLTLIKNNMSITKNDLYQVLLNQLGYSRTGSAIVTRFDTAFEKLLEAGFIELRGDTITLFKL